MSHEQLTLFDMVGGRPVSWQEYLAEVRRELAATLEEELRPEFERDPYLPGEYVLDRAIAIVKGEP